MADPHECIQILSESVIEPDVELVVVSAVRHQLLKIIGAGCIRRRQIAQHLASKAGHRNRGTGSVERAGERVPDVDGHDAGSLGQRRDRGKDKRFRNLGEAFVIKEEEGSVFYDWPAESEAELVANERRFYAPSRFEEADRIEDCVAVILPQAAMKLIGAGAIRCVDY